MIERPRVPVINPHANVPGPGGWLMWGEWRVASIDGSAPSAAHPYPIVIAVMSFVIGVLFVRETKDVDIYAKD